jgi:hypothetical protein
MHGSLPFVRHGDGRRRASSCDQSDVNHLAPTNIIIHGTMRALPVSTRWTSDTRFCKTVLLSNVRRRSSRLVQVHLAGRSSYICVTRLLLEMRNGAFAIAACVSSLEMNCDCGRELDGRSLSKKPSAIPGIGDPGLQWA